MKEPWKKLAGRRDSWRLSIPGRGDWTVAPDATAQGCALDFRGDGESSRRLYASADQAAHWGEILMCERVAATPRSLRDRVVALIQTRDALSAINLFFDRPVTLADRCLAMTQPVRAFLRLSRLASGLEVVPHEVSPGTLKAILGEAMEDPALLDIVSDYCEENGLSELAGDTQLLRGFLAKAPSPCFDGGEYLDIAAASDVRVLGAQLRQRMRDRVDELRRTHGAVRIAVCEVCQEESPGGARLVSRLVVFPAPQEVT